MILTRIFTNALVLAAEVAAVCTVAAFAYWQPLAFAGLTAILAFATGFTLERRQLAHNRPFYFDRPLGAWGQITIFVIALVDAVIKALLAGVVALLTLSGTDQNRHYWVAVVLGVVLFAGTSLLRALAIRFGARPLRWGYFRLAAPLGLLYTIGLNLLEINRVIASPGLGDIGRTAIFDTPSRPSVAQASELLFLVKQYFDDLIVALIGVFLPADAAQALGVVVSVNVLTGFVIAIYALLIAEGIRRLEERPA